jgi:copper resistance protein B
MKLFLQSVMAVLLLVFHSPLWAMSDKGDDSINSFTLFDRLEFEGNTGVQLTKWEMSQWIGTDINKLYIKSEGDYAQSQGIVGTADIQLVYSRSISEFWDIQIGARRGIQPEMAWDGVLSLQGIAPQFVEVELESFYNQYGNVLGRLTLRRDFLLSQRLILTPRFEVDVTKDAMPKRSIKPGVYELEAGMRLRYELAREFAPYIGFDYVEEQSLSEARTGVRGVSGIRFWF